MRNFITKGYIVAQSLDIGILVFKIVHKHYFKREEVLVMRIILVHAHYSEAHLQDVIESMRTLGAPRIQAVWSDVYNAWCALEGCHRIRAAKVLGLTPEINAVEYSDTPFIDNMTISYIVDTAYNVANCGGEIEF